jgi:fructokinase
LNIDPSSSDYGKLLTVPSVKKMGWKDKSIVSLLKAEFKTSKVTIQTDVNASAYSEFMNRRDSLKSSLAYITVGTGIGVGLIINSKPITGLMHPEGGHIPLIKESTDLEEEANSCNFHQSCIEGFSSSVFASNLLGIDINELKDYGDHQVFEDIAKNVGQLCASVCLITSVEKIVIGGGLSQSSNFLTNVNESFSKHINSYLPKGVIPKDYIEICEDYDKVGIQGAAYLSM